VGTCSDMGNGSTFMSSMGSNKLLWVMVRCSVHVLSYVCFGAVWRYLFDV
jgi:hypothetical protein